MIDVDVKYDVILFCDNPECSYMEMPRIITEVSKKEARERSY